MKIKSSLIVLVIVFVSSGMTINADEGLCVEQSVSDLLKKTQSDEKTKSDEKTESKENATTEQVSVKAPSTQVAKKRGYQGELLKNNPENMTWFDGAVSFVPSTYGDISLMTEVAEKVLREDFKKQVEMKNIEMQDEAQKEILIKAQKEALQKLVEQRREELVLSFSKFAPQIQRFSPSVSPLIEESLSVEKLKKHHITLAEKSFIIGYANSNEDIHEYFKARVITEEQVKQFATEMYIFLHDFLRSMPRARAAYKRDLVRQELVKGEAAANKRTEKGDKAFNG
jgi:hypothetical protein